LDQDALSYMRTTFGTTDFAAIAQSAESTELDSLLELIFYPNAKMLAGFETHWGETVFTTTDKAATEDALLSDPPQTVLTDPAGGLETRWVMRLTVPGFALCSLLQRLEISWQPAARIAEALKRLPESRFIAVRIRLRHANVAWNPGQVALTFCFLERFPPMDDDFEHCLDYLLSILSELPPQKDRQEDHYAFLCDKKYFCFQALCRAEAFERRRQQSSMELLMLQGERAAHGDIVLWREWMRLIDRINMVLFGRTEYFHQT